MKTTKKDIVTYMRKMLATNKAWAVKALVRIYKENQTEQEQVAQITKEDNGIGFTGIDAGFLSSLAKQYIEKNFLSDKQLAFVFKKMPKYAAQVVKMSNLDKLTSMVKEELYESDCETEEGRRNEIRAHGRAE